MSKKVLMLTIVVLTLFYLTSFMKFTSSGPVVRGEVPAYASPSGSAPTTTTTIFQCKNVGETCVDDSDCCSGVCEEHCVDYDIRGICIQYERVCAEGQQSTTTTTTVPSQNQTENQTTTTTTTVSTTSSTTTIASSGGGGGGGSNSSHSSSSDQETGSSIEETQQEEEKVCNQTDKGRDYLEKGKTYVDGLEFIDYCEDEINLHEYFCDDNELGEETVDCLEYCQKIGNDSGKCVKGACECYTTPANETTTQPTTVNTTTTIKKESKSPFQGLSVSTLGVASVIMAVLASVGFLALRFFEII